MRSQRIIGCLYRSPIARSVVLIGLVASHAFGQFTTVINVPPDPAPSSIGSDTQLNLFDGGTLPSSDDAPFNAGDPSGSDANMELNIFGGWAGNYISANSGSKVNVSGGSVGYDFNANGGSTVTISGGAVGIRFNANNGSVVNISGGSIGDGFRTFSRSTVTISGGEFRIGGVPVSGLDSAGSSVSLDVPLGASLSGTLADGRPFALAYGGGGEDFFAAGVLTLEAAELPPIGPTMITASTDAVPLGIRQGQTLRVDDGGVVPDNFSAGWGSTVNVEPGGIVSDNFEVVGAEVNVSGGSIGYGFDAFSGSTVNISGGSVGTSFGHFCGLCLPDFSALSGSTVNISGGSVGDRFYAESGSTVNISGGSVANDFFVNGGTVNVSRGSIGNRFNVRSGGMVNIFGGSVGWFYVNDGGTVNISGGAFEGLTFQAWSGSTVNLFGTHFLLDSLDITASLTQNVPFTISDRDVTLSGLLADGSAFSFLTNNVRSGGTLTVTLVPEPNAIVLVLVLCGICAFGRSAGRRVGIGY